MANGAAGSATPAQGPPARGNNTVQGGIAVMRTDPQQIMLHTIEDHQLTTLTNMSRPYSLGFATTALGAALGLIPTVLAIVSRRSAGLAMSDIWTLLLFGGCIVAAVIFGWAAWGGISEANKTIRDIRSRPANPC